MTFCVADSKIDELVKVNKTQKQLLYFLLKSKTKFNLDKCIKALQISSRTFYRNVEVLLNKNLIIKKSNDDKLYHNESDVIYQLEPNFENSLRGLFDTKQVTKCHKPTDKMAHNECQNVTTPSYIYKRKNRGGIENKKTPNPLKGESVFFDDEPQSKPKKQNDNANQIKNKALQIANEINYQNDEFINKLNDFLDIRNKKHTITDAYISDLANELKKIKHPLQAINKCLAKGWINCEANWFITQQSTQKLKDTYDLPDFLQAKVDNNEMTEVEAQRELNFMLADAQLYDKFHKTNTYEQLKNMMRKDYNNVYRFNEQLQLI